MPFKNKILNIFNTAGCLIACTLCPDKNWTLVIVNNRSKLMPALTKRNAQYFSAFDLLSRETPDFTTVMAAQQPGS